MKLARFGGILVASVTAAAPAEAAPTFAPVEYSIAFPNAAHHEADITIGFSGVPDGPLEIRMARSSPGRYAIHEFAKNVYSVTATDGAGRPLTVRRTDPYSWLVDRHDGAVRFRYTLFANRGDGTYSQINRAHAHLNVPATLAFAPALAGRPARVRIALPDPDWNVATQLFPAPDGSWHARDLQYLMDSPIEVGPLRERRWSASEPGGNYVIRLMVHAPDTKKNLDRFAAMAERVYRAHVAMWGDIPDYDGGTYTFLADYQPYVKGDGMEHRNSTYLTDPRSLDEADFDQIGTLSHEVFHSWNVERLRPADLEPFDFTRANPTASLWFGEGFTSYYGPLLVRRAEVSSVDQYLEELSGTLSYVLNSTGRRFGSPAEMSLRAPFVDAATSIDPANSNIFTSYYPYGAVIALALDLTLRQRGNGRTLDDMMRALWRSHGATQRPYAASDLEAALAATAGDPGFAAEFFRKSINGSELPDIAPLLAQAGLTLRQAKPDQAYLGAIGVTKRGDRTLVTGYPAPGTPLHAAAIAADDELVSVDGKRIDDEEGWTAAAKALKVGKPVAITVRSLGKLRTVQVTPVADPALEVVRDEMVGKVPSAEQLSFRRAWLGGDGAMLN